MKAAVVRVTTGVESNNGRVVVVMLIEVITSGLYGALGGAVLKQFSKEGFDVVQWPPCRVQQRALEILLLRTIAWWSNVPCSPYYRKSGILEKVRCSQAAKRFGQGCDFRAAQAVTPGCCYRYLSPGS